MRSKWYEPHVEFSRSLVEFESDIVLRLSLVSVRFSISKLSSTTFTFLLTTTPDASLAKIITGSVYTEKPHVLVFRHPDLGGSSAVLRSLNNETRPLAGSLQQCDFEKGNPHDSSYGE